MSAVSLYCIHIQYAFRSRRERYSFQSLVTKRKRNFFSFGGSFLVLCIYKWSSVILFIKLFSNRSFYIVLKNDGNSSQNVKKGRFPTEVTQVSTRLWFTSFLFTNLLSDPPSALNWKSIKLSIEVYYFWSLVVVVFRIYLPCLNVTNTVKRKQILLHLLSTLKDLGLCSFRPT